MYAGVPSRHDCNATPVWRRVTSRTSSPRFREPSTGPIGRTEDSGLIDVVDELIESSYRAGRSLGRRRWRVVGVRIRLVDSAESSPCGAFGARVGHHPNPPRTA